MSIEASENSRFTDLKDEPVDRLLSPIRGYEDQLLLPLIETVKPISGFFKDIEDYIYVALYNCQNPSDNLTQQESASIHLYTMQFHDGRSLYRLLNQSLRAENREELKLWFSFLKLFLTALHKLPSQSQTVWRGVKNVDLSSKYKKGTKFAWWGVSSCTVDIEVLESNVFLGRDGLRTLFSIECINGKSISNHSYFKNTEKEMILMPGSYFEVIGQLNPAPQLHIIQLKEIPPPIIFVKPPFPEPININSIPLKSDVQEMINVNNVTLTHTQTNLTRMKYVMKEMYELHEFTTPHYFFILPAKHHDWTAINTVHSSFRIHYKLYFLCECSDEPKKLHFAPHDGYSIKKPREFIARYGSYLQITLGIVRMLLTLGNFVAPHLGNVSTVAGNTIPLSVQSSTNFDDTKQKVEFVQILLDKIDNNMTGTASPLLQQGKLPGVSLQAIDLRELDNYLELVDNTHNLGNLYRIVTTNGHVRWVCIEHYNAFSFNNKISVYISQLQTMKGRFNQENNEAVLTQANLTIKNVEMLTSALKNGFNIVELVLQKCIIYEGYLDTLLDVIINRSSIRCLKMTDLDVRNWIGKSKYICEYMIVHFNNQSFKVRFNDHYQYGNTRMFIRFLLQNKIYRTLDFSACDFLGYEEEFRRCLDTNRILTGLNVQYANNIDILNVISTLKSNTLHQLKLSDSLRLPSISSHFCEILRKIQTLVEIDIMDLIGFNDEAFITDLLSTLREHKSIKYLSLHIGNVNPSNRKEVCLIDSLLNGKFISRLCLSESVISHQLTRALVHAAQEHRSLNHLEFYKSKIDDDDVSQLQSLRNNEILIHLIFSEQTRWHLALEETNSLFNKKQFDSSTQINYNTTWKQEGFTIAGGNGQGSQLNQLCYPESIFVDDDQSIYIVDCSNNRIVQWKCNATFGNILVGENGQGNQTNQLNYPRDMIIDKQNNSLIITDSGNRRVMRWPLENNTKNGQIIIENIDCLRLTMDKDGSVYVSDYKKHEVRRWKRGDQHGTIVAGGNGDGSNLNQLSYPNFIFVDEEYSLYVSDSQNQRVMKWLKDAKEGIIVAGGNGKGNSLTQLFYPRGVIVDQLGQIYVADGRNYRVMCWCKGAKAGTIVVGGNGRGQQSNQLYGLDALSFDRQGNLYVADYCNNQIQKFEIN